MAKTALRVGAGVIVCAVVIAFFGIHAPAKLMTGPPTTICGALGAANAADIKAKDYVNAGVSSQEYFAHGCDVQGMIALANNVPNKVCKIGIKNIATFLNTCPTLDPAYGLILRSTPISFDGQVVPESTLATDIAAVCKDKTTPPLSGGPTMRQRQEFRVVQSLRTIYHMDSQGDTGCIYPWTGGKSFYKWMISEEGGIDVRDDGQFSDCCEPPPAGGTKDQFGILVPSSSANVSPDDYTWLGISNEIALIAHETRHEPIPPSQNASFIHTTCCPLQSPGQPASCDQSYQETANLAPYGIQYWLFRAWLKGQVNVGYGCMPDSNTTLFLQNTANGYVGRFCAMAPAQVTTPANPGGTCPP